MLSEERKNRFCQERKRHRYFWTAIGFAAVLLTMYLPAWSALAAEAGKSAGEVVFLLDASGSMEKQDKDRLAIDAIRQGVYSLPSGYQAGLVVYCTKLQAAGALGADKEQLEDMLGAVTYTGYTNAGQGLSQAVGLFSEQEGVERLIVMLSDGEIDMPDQQQKEASRELYAQAVMQAKEKGIKICIIAVGNERSSPWMHIFDGAGQTDGTIYWQGQSGSLTQLMDRIITDKLNFPRQEIKAVEEAGQAKSAGSVHVAVPQGADSVKVFLTSESELFSVEADYRAEQGQTAAGKHFASVDLKRPSSETVDLRLEAGDLSGVRAYLVTEYTAEPKLTVKYRSEELPRTEEEIRKNIPPVYEHWADITVRLEDAGGSHENLWQASGCEGGKIPYYLNGVLFEGTIQGGELKNTISAEGVNTVEVLISGGETEGIWHIRQPVAAELVKVPDPVFEPAPDYRPLLGIAGVLAAALIVLLASGLKKRGAEVYSGKLNLYVVKTGDGKDVPPQTYRLFGRSGSRLTLNQILTSCGLRFGRRAAKDIVFFPGPGHSLVIKDQSERCTVLRGTEILKKGTNYPIFYGEKLTVAFEEDAAELEFHYKALKPSERN